MVFEFDCPVVPVPVSRSLSSSTAICLQSLQRVQRTEDCNSPISTEFGVSVCKFFFNQLSCSFQFQSWMPGISDSEKILVGQSDLMKQDIQVNCFEAFTNISGKVRILHGTEPHRSEIPLTGLDFYAPAQFQRVGIFANRSTFAWNVLTRCRVFLC